MADLKAKVYDLSSVKGMTSKQLDEHYKLYLGYVSKLNEIDKMSKNPQFYSGSNPTYSTMRSLKMGETYSLDGVILHQYYFKNITNSNNYISDKLINIICVQWGCLDNFLSYLKQVCLSMRGWAVVCFDPLTSLLRITGSDLHDYGPVWNAYPILVIDVYEHAYFMDFGTNRSKYIDVMFKNLNWDVISSRFDKCISLLKE
ncbi:superoxide dismutase (plasmid) [Clostridium botulinum]|uniref:superoxide dismutase n=1 Tax=Clostridium botulinum C/D str. DC5 TaxID=1443128 RepID=A0A0A0HX02_CLOBO|nr:Fe-Mn family superoxide dismutase [Clostridium botulinum]KEI02848.1 amino acid ABC transporter substrate-binding protein [Clostridium botulinum C/D str. BKT75002]KEI09725.1 amino acid ABC transporter substrate-binding protein [Clostridium botulinum C/D str. BKT2873]KGM92908.1 amino acid ABC transporter substrate-binding protein [Clostridium botulinum C/D str. DC5]KOC52061.1 amino acid ABC transporter substrate-binding protein [Clostridium botulinum]KOC54641.1 amino acid ABC transporter subs